MVGKMHVKWRVVESLRDDGRRLNGDWIRNERKRRGLTLREFAKLIGTSAPYLSKIERGNSSGGREVNERISFALTGR